MFNSVEDIKFIDSMLVDLFPLSRSLSGKGTECTLEYLQRILPGLYIEKVASGSYVHDWVVPPEWNIRDGYVENALGKKIIDFKKSNLHVMSYSKGIDKIVMREELMEHLYTLPGYPEWIPYRTSYYNNDWGFCAADNLTRSKDFIEPFHVFIDAEHISEGYIKYGTLLKKGIVDEEIVISTYCCHPSLANDNLSGLVTSTLLFKSLIGKQTYYSYRLVVAPETIGAVAFLARYGKNRIVASTVVTCIAGPDRYSLKESWDNQSQINKLSHQVLKEFTNDNYITYLFDPFGSDERQYSSPGYRINCPSFHKSKYYEYKEYHTSADNLDFISSRNIWDSVRLYQMWIYAIENNKTPTRINPYCEPQLGRRELYPRVGGHLKSMSILTEDTEEDYDLDSICWVLFLSNGSNTITDIAERSGLSISRCINAYRLLKERGLVKG